MFTNVPTSDLKEQLEQCKEVLRNPDSTGDKGWCAGRVLQLEGQIQARNEAHRVAKYALLNARTMAEARAAQKELDQIEEIHLN
jgi:hypothetical protein